ncbi:MAG: C40 family peptidase [Alicyclobacillus sp.]|nr:C40 family peptidase [Alicyclobacillus sp.]
MHLRKGLAVTGAAWVCLMTPVAAWAATTSASATPATYTVQAGDTYFKIGQALHQPYSLLEDINSPGSDVLLPGQVLRLAQPYVVQPGDTVWKIAQAHGLTTAAIEQWNQLAQPDVLYPGTTLWLPPQTPANGTGVSAAVVSSTSAPATAQPSLGVGDSSAAASAIPAETVNRAQIVSYAEQFLGTPYVYGGASPSGFDCSGLVQTVFAHFDISLPRRAVDQEKAGTPVAESQLQPGDLVFFNTTGAPYSHVGIYIGQGQFISATSSHGVTISSLTNSSYWSPRYTGAVDPLS